jgi:hypothetical protein
VPSLTNRCDAVAREDMSIPSFKNRSPNEIVAEKKFFESSGRIYKALSWLDYAKSNKNISALEYAALETRLAIEQLFFEQLVVGVGTKLVESEYKKCSGNAKKLNAMLEKLIIKYDQLVEFTKAMAPSNMPVTKWDNYALIQLSGKVSNYLHWSGGLDVTVKSASWFENGISIVENAANYIWQGLTTGNTAIMAIDKMEPEIRELWNLFVNDEITLARAVEMAEALEPILQSRLTCR